jgi:hypothetical protein
VQAFAAMCKLMTNPRAWQMILWLENHVDLEGEEEPILVGSGVWLRDTDCASQSSFLNKVITTIASFPSPLAYFGVSSDWQHQGQAASL